MSSHAITFHLLDRVRQRPETSGFTPGFAADGANTRITMGALAQRDRPVGDDVAVTDIAVAPLSTLPPTPEAWAGHDDARLLEFIVERYHRPLRGELPRLQALAARINLDEDAHRPPDHQRAVRLLDDLAALLLEHLDEEEEALFPAILMGEPLRGLDGAALDDHHVALRLLGELRRLCAAATSSSDPICRALAHGLFTLERELVAHIALETDVLWPRLRRCRANAIVAG